MELKGKRALVTGGAVRLGATICRALALEGLNLVVHYNHSNTEAGSLRHELENMGIACEIACMDFFEPEGCEVFFNRIVTDSGPIDILVNSASPYDEDTLRTLTAAQALRSYAAGAVAPLLLTRAFAAQDRPGCVINILDARMSDYDRYHVSYSLAKRTLRDITRLTSAEFSPLVRVNGVAPGFVVFPEQGSGLKGKAVAESALLSNLPGPEDIVSCILFLLKNDTITGQILYPDSGRNFKGNTYG